MGGGGEGGGGGRWWYTKYGALPGCRVYRGVVPGTRTVLYRTRQNNTVL